MAIEPPALPFFGPIANLTISQLSKQPLATKQWRLFEQSVLLEEEEDAEQRAKNSDGEKQKDLVNLIASDASHSHSQWAVAANDSANLIAIAHRSLVTVYKRHKWRDMTVLGSFAVSKGALASAFSSNVDPATCTSHQRSRRPNIGVTPGASSVLMLGRLSFLLLRSQLSEPKSPLNPSSAPRFVSPILTLMFAPSLPSSDSLVTPVSLTHSHDCHFYVGLSFFLLLHRPKPPPPPPLLPTF